MIATGEAPRPRIPRPISSPALAAEPASSTRVCPVRSITRPNAGAETAPKMA
jgi:hypothetical protein